MSKKGSVPKRQYTDEFKIEAVKLAESVGGNQAAKRLGVPDSSVWNWVRLKRAGKLGAVKSSGGIRCVTPLASKRAWTSSTGSRASTIASECIRLSAIRRP